jgi:hypothetical protein
MSVKLKTPSNGSVTLAPEDTGSDVVLTVPAVAGEILNDQSDIETQVKSATNATGSAPIYACRAWVNFDGANGSIRASGNVSSVTRNATGLYTVNLATAMPDSNYSIGGVVSSSTGSNRNTGVTVDDFTAAPTTSSFRVITRIRDSVTNVDCDLVYLQIFR